MNRWPAGFLSLNRQVLLDGYRQLPPATAVNSATDSQTFTPATTMDQHDLIQSENVLHDCTEKLRLLEHQVYATRREIARWFPSFILFLRNRPSQDLQIPPHMQALPESLQVLILRSLVLNNAIDDVKELFRGIGIPVSPEVTDLEPRLDGIASLFAALNIIEPNADQREDVAGAN